MEFATNSKFHAQKKERPLIFKNLNQNFLFLVLIVILIGQWLFVLVGGGQEINTGEAGISEWIESLNRSFPDWHIYISLSLLIVNMEQEKYWRKLNHVQILTTIDELHLSVSMRSFRAEHVSLLVKQLLDLNIDGCSKDFANVKENIQLLLRGIFPKQNNG